MALQYENIASSPLSFTRKIAEPLNIEQFNQPSQSEVEYDYQPPAPFKPNKLMLLGATLKDLGATFQGRDSNSLQSLVSEQNRSLEQYNQSMMQRALERSKMQREDKRYDTEVMRENQKVLDTAKMQAYEAGVPQEKLVGAVSLDEIGAALSEVKQAENNGIDVLIKQQQLSNAQAQAAKLQQDIEQGIASGPLELEQKKLELQKTQEEITSLKQNAEAVSQMGASGIGLRPKTIKRGDITYEVPETEQERQDKLAQEKEKDIQKEITKGVTADVAGRVTLAKESLGNIKDIRSILFPDGTPKSFKRGVAFGSNLPGPGKALPLAKDSQTVNRKMGASLAGRQLIQTGMAARPEETAKLVAQFAPNAFSNSTSAWDALNELETFYNSYLDTTVPERRFGKDADKKSSGNELTTPSGISFTYKKK